MNAHSAPQTGLIPRATIESICARRDLAMQSFLAAHAALSEAQESTEAAFKAARHEAPAETNRYNYGLSAKTVDFLHATKVPELDEFMRAARHHVDVSTWAHLFDLTDMHRLMDSQAKGQLAKDLLSDPPEATVDNVYATLEQFMADSGTIFRRGIANVFSKLDRRFKSHDGWKIGSRIILTNAFNEWGGWTYSSNREEMITDIERTFSLLDGKPISAVGSIKHAIDANRQGGRGARQSEIESDFFKVRIFMNGNCHIWFKRNDLVKEVNRMLAEYYGASLADDEEEGDVGGLNTPKTTLAKRFGFFPTPLKMAEGIAYEAQLSLQENDPPLKVLEPSAGTGNLVRAVLAYDDYRWSQESEYTKRHTERKHRAKPIVTAIEVQSSLCDGLRALLPSVKVICADFLTVPPDPIYDRVVMNPPFDRERDIDHVMHALKFLKPDGFLIAIMSAGTEFRVTAKSEAFRQKIAKMNGRFNDNPPGSFTESGTNCNTITLRVQADGRSFYR